MFKFFKSFAIPMFLVSFFAGGVLLLTPTPVYAGLFDNARDEACRGVTLQNGGPCNPTGRNLNEVVKAILNIMSIIVGIIAIFMIVIAGLKFVTSQGESSNISAARSTLLYAVVGLVVVALAQFIVRFVLAKTT